MSNAPLAFLYPGQGSQTIGMGQSLAQASRAARQCFDQADALLGRSLSTLCFEGPEEELKQTENTQPALFVCSAVATAFLAERGLRPAVVAGHSLGEYSALHAAGVLDFETGLALVDTRGRAMAEAGRQTPGTMAAIIGLDIDKVDAVCAQASQADSIAVVANDNSPGQTVISGSIDAIERACVLAREAGAKRALPLPVSGAFHSPLVAGAATALEAKMVDAEFRPPTCDYISQVTGQIERDPDTIRSLLVEQLTSRVRWVDSIRLLAQIAPGVAALEVGPGKVLAGLVRRIERSITVQPAGTAADIEKLAAE